jgi:beta-lactamase regulating signal transducer with metallopeptidase domain
LHFIWQGTVVAGVAAAALRLCRNAPARVRYALACAALVGMTAAPVITASLLSPRGSQIDRPAENARTVQLEPAGGSSEELTENVGPPSRPTRGRVESALEAAVWIWLGGVALLLLRTVRGWWRVHALQAVSRSLEASPWQDAADRIAASLRISYAVRIVESSLVEAPAVIGWMAPVVLLPLATVAILTPFQVHAILAHELAHVRRNDYLVNLLQTMAETFLFYHPAVWWLSARIRLEREHCCDDVAVDVCGDRAGYAAALASLEASRGTDAAWSLAATGGQLLGRIRRLLNVPKAEDARLPTWPVVAAMLVVGVVTVAAAGGAVFFGTRPFATAPQSATGRTVEQWQLRSGEHFDIYYRGETESRLDDLSGRVERAYGQVSADLKHDLSARVPLVVFGTRREMQQSSRP